MTDDLPITEDLVPPPAPIWDCACGWSGPSRDMEWGYGSKTTVHCPKCRSTDLRLRKDEP